MKHAGWPRRIARALGLAVVAAGVAGCASLVPLPGTVQEEVDAAAGGRLDGIIVYVDQAGESPALYAAGWRDRAAEVPADPAAYFRIASISKLYIAVATAKLVGNRSLSLDDTLADLRPDLVGRIEYAGRITLRMMLQHRSGIPDFIDDGEFDWSTRQRDPNDNLELVLDERADFRPGARRRYSNTNYLLIASILDRVLGYSHRSYIENQVLAPLGLTQTHGLIDDVAIDDVASGYHHGIPDDLKELYYGTPGGSMVATASDVGVFLRALIDGSLLNDREQAVYSSVYDYEHTGWVPGYQSKAHYIEDIDAVVVQFVSSTGGNSEMNANIAYNRITRILRRQQ